MNTTSKRNYISILSALSITLDLFFAFLEILGIDVQLERLSKRKSPVRFRYIIMRAVRWFSCPKNWAVSYTQIAAHLAGFETIGLRAAAARTVRYLDLDIDHADHDFFDKRITKILELFGPNKCIVLYRPESGNFSILLRIHPMMPHRLEDAVNNILAAHGLKPKAGFIEIFPSVSRGRRIPFAGDQKAYQYHSGMPVEIRSKAAQLETFIDLGINNPVNLYRLEKSLAPTQRPKEEAAKIVKQNAIGMARVGISPNYTSSTKQLMTLGLIAPSTRYEAEKRLILHHYRCGRSQETTFQIIKVWYTCRTNGLSKDWISDPNGVLRDLKNHIRSYFAWLDEHWRPKQTVIPPAQLNTQDVAAIMEICGWDVRFAEFTYDLLKWTKARRQYQHDLWLSSRIVYGRSRDYDGNRIPRIPGFSNGRDAHRKYMKQLRELGILRLVDPRYRQKERCRVWAVYFHFRKEGRPIPTGLSLKQALCLAFDQESIDANMKPTTAWTIKQLRKSIEYDTVIAAQEDERRKRETKKRRLSDIIEKAGEQRPMTETLAGPVTVQPQDGGLRRLRVDRLVDD